MYPKIVFISRRIQDEHLSPRPIKFSIDPVYPNPVRTSAKIQLNVPEGTDEKIEVSIFDTTGRLIRRWLFDRSGKSIVFAWDILDQNSNPVPSGVYFVQARIGKFRAAQKLLFLK